MIHLQNPSKLREKQMDKVGQILHPKLRRIIILSDVNYPTDNLSQMDNLSLAWIQSLWWRHVMHLSKEDNPLPACRQINQYNYFQPYLWTDKQRGKRLCVGKVLWMKWHPVNLLGSLKQSGDMVGEYLKLKICRSCGLSFTIVFCSWKRSFAPLCIPSCDTHAVLLGGKLVIYLHSI